jgi:hypothetical protein
MRTVPPAPADLHTRGVIDDAEYERLKAKAKALA